MTTAHSDTHHDADRIQMQLLRHAGHTRRVEMAIEMTRFALDSATLALQRRYPNESTQEIAMRLFEQRYGTQLAERLRVALTVSRTDHDIVS
jgi:hypothetical protein